MKKYVIVCDKCGKQLDDAAMTLNYDDTAMDFCGSCAKKLKMLLSSFVNAPDIHSEPVETSAPKPLPKPRRKAEIDMPKVFALRRAGWTWTKIGEEFGVTDSTIINHVRAYQEAHKDENDTVRDE